MNAFSQAAPVLLCIVGLLLSFEYKGENYRAMLWVFRGLSVAMAVLAALGWLLDYPGWLSLGVSLAAIAVNLPLGAIGLKKK